MFGGVSLTNTVTNGHAAQILALPERLSGTHLKLPSQDQHNNDVLTRSLLSTVPRVCFYCEHFVIMATYMEIIISDSFFSLWESKCTYNDIIFQENCPALVSCSCAIRDSPTSVKLQLAPQPSVGHPQHLSHRKLQSE